MTTFADLAAILDEIRANANGCIVDSDEDCADVRTSCLGHNALRAVAALEAVLKAHRPSTTDGRCCWCRDADGQRSAWPCGEYLTITRALNGDTDG